MKISPFRGIVLLVLFLSGATSTSAQYAAHNADAIKSDRNGMDIAISFHLEDGYEVSGFQFDITYNPEAFSPELKDCLSGLPESHRGPFAVCNDLPEKSMVRVVVLDLGRNRLLPSKKLLGEVGFRYSKKSARAARANPPSVENVILANRSGKEMQGVDSSDIFTVALRR